jgi:ankyrin repeat protein
VQYRVVRNLAVSGADKAGDCLYLEDGLGAVMEQVVIKLAYILVIERIAMYKQIFLAMVLLSYGSVQSMVKIDDMRSPFDCEVSLMHIFNDRESRFSQVPSEVLRFCLLPRVVATGTFASALYLAVSSGCTEEVRKLLSSSDPAVAEQIRSTPLLHIAARNGHGGVVELLLGAQADPNTALRLGETPLHFAAMGNHVHLVRRLLSAGADKNDRTDCGYSALHFAARWGCLQVVEELLAAGAEKHLRSYGGDTALDVAVKQGHSEIVRVLEAAGCLRKAAREELLRRDAND